MSSKKQKIDSAITSLFSSGRRPVHVEEAAGHLVLEKIAKEAQAAPVAVAVVETLITMVEEVAMEASADAPFDPPAPSVDLVSDPVLAAVPVVVPEAVLAVDAPMQAAAAPVDDDEEVVEALPEPSAVPVKAVAPAPSAPASTEVKNESNETKKVVVFTLANEYYAVDIAGVEGIIKMQSITEVPHAHHYVVGVTNLRGSVLPVIDLRARFGMGEKQADNQSRIIVVSVKGEKIGIIVDAVSEVLSIPAASIEPLPALVTSLDTDYVLGVAKADQRLITLVDLSRVLEV